MGIASVSMCLKEELDKDIEKRLQVISILIILSKIP